MTHHRRLASLVFTVVLITASSVLIGSCNGQKEPDVVEPPPMVVENTELRLRLAGVPGGFDVVANNGAQLVLRPAEPSSDGKILFANKPPEAGQNLPAEVKAHRALIEDSEGGEYRGAQELVSQLGTTYYSRGRYLTDGELIEETTIFALHPYADRIMTITYLYPAGDDAGERVQQLFEILEIVEGLD